MAYGYSAKQSDNGGYDIYRNGCDMGHLNSAYTSDIELFVEQNDPLGFEDHEKVVEEINLSILLEHTEVPENEYTFIVNIILYLIIPAIYGIIALIVVLIKM